ncbi:EamA family transporter [Desulfobulbus alkaliphilus]|uniref:EamA family transporter n=1 Tax=Desulfobulbus alkaliphilus TaxID=869814 RepID=UPI001964AC0F|nr:EamA family transporter [Desulfobulbus alkaliphilus]
MTWLSLALLCAFSLAAADALTKKLLVGYSAVELVVVRFGVTAVLLLPLLLVNPPQAIPPLMFWVWVGSALPLEILAMILYMTAIRDSPLSLTLPYLAFTPVFVVLTALLLLGEQVSLQGFFGILLVVAGAYGLNVEHARIREPRSWLAPILAIGREKGSRLMLGVAFIYSMTSVLGKGALQYMPATTFGPLYFVVLGLFTLLVFSWHQQDALRVLWRPSWGHLVIGLLMAMMVVTHFLAIELVQVAYMISVKRTSILFGIVLGALLFAETRLLQHLLAAALMVAGVALIVL